MEDVKLCVKCKHWDGSTKFPYCTRPVVSAQNPVTGKPMRIFESCFLQRFNALYREQRCGTYGTFWEPRPTFWGIIKRFLYNNEPSL